VEIQARNELVERHLHLARAVASALVSRLPSNVDIREDLEAEASLQLIAGVERYDPRRGVPIDLWLTRFLMWRTREMFRRRNLREAKADQLLDTYDRADPATQERDVDHARVRAKVRARINELPERSRKVIEMRYDHGHRLKQIGKDLKVSESRTSQIHTEVMAELRADWRMQELRRAA